MPPRRVNASIATGTRTGCRCRDVVRLRACEPPTRNVGFRCTEMSDGIVEANDANFEAEVVERSRQVPVLVDFWAPWCGPCRTLTPRLEAMVAAHRGAFVLAKVNIDGSPGLAQALRVQSVPTLLGIRDGRAVVRAVGALADPELGALLEKLLPAPAETAAALGDEAYAAGDGARAEVAYRQSLELDPRCDRAVLGMARVLADRGEDGAALEMVERILPGPWLEPAERLAAELRLRAGGVFDEAPLRARLALDPRDLGARFELGEALAARGRYEDALCELLEIVRLDRAYREGAARQAMLDIFEVLGANHELVARYRSELAKVLFR